MNNYKEKYENLIEQLKKAKEEHGGYAFSSVIDKIIPELCESEDEKIRKSLIKSFENQHSCNFPTVDGFTREQIIAWLEKQTKQNYIYADEDWYGFVRWFVKERTDNYTLIPSDDDIHNWGNIILNHARKLFEKQGKQDNNEDLNILQRFSFYSYKDEPNILYLSGLYVNEECRNKGIGTKILEVADEVAKSLNCHAIRLKTKKDSNAERLYRTHGYNSLPTEEKDEIWLEKQEWGEEDEANMDYSSEIIGFLKNYIKTYGCIAMNSWVNWLKSLKNKVQPQLHKSGVKRIKK